MVSTALSCETKSKQPISYLFVVLPRYGHFSGINRKVQLKYHKSLDKSSSCHSSEEESQCNRHDHTPYLLLILKWGGELTTDGKQQAEDLGTAFRKLYPGGEGSKSGIIKQRTNSNISCVLISVFFNLFKNKTIEDKSEVKHCEAL